MKTLKGMKILLVVFLCYNCAEQQPSKENSDKLKEELVKTLEKFNTAFQTANVEKLELMITDHYQHTNGTAKAIDKETWINYLRKRQADISSGKLEVITYEMDEIKVNFYDNTAIVSAKVVVSNKIDGEIRENEYRVTNLWVHDSGAWKRAGFHDGKIK